MFKSGDRVRFIDNLDNQLCIFSNGVDKKIIYTINTYNGEYISVNKKVHNWEPGQYFNATRFELVQKKPTIIIKR